MQMYANENLRHLQRFPNQMLTNQSLLEIFSPALTHLNLSNHLHVSEQLISTIGHRCPKLTHLDLSYLQIHDSILIEIANTCLDL